MSKPKLGPWMPESVKPVHRGVYQVSSFVDGSNWYAKWNGRYWAFAYTNIRTAARSVKEKTRFQERRWRGLAEKPNA